MRPPPKKQHATWRERRDAIRAVVMHNKTPEEVSATIDFTPTQVKRWVEGWQLTGIIKPETKRPHVTRSSLTMKAAIYISTALNANNGLSANMVRAAVWNEFGELASRRCTADHMAKQGWGHKVATSKQQLQDRELNRAHAQERAMYHPRQFLFADETHKAGKTFQHTRGYGQWGRRAFVPMSRCLNSNWTVLACFNYTGIVDFGVTELSNGKATSTKPKAMDREAFLNMMAEVIVPHLQPAWNEDGTPTGQPSSPTACW